MSSHRELETEPTQPGPDSAWLRNAYIATETWFASITPADPELSAMARQRLPELQRQGLARLLLALGREGLLPVQPPTHGSYRCELPGMTCTLICDAFHASLILLRSDLRKLRACWQDGRIEAIEHPARLLEIIAACRDEDAAPWQRLATEITDSLLNEALALAAHERTNVDLPPAADTVSPETLIRRLQQSGPSPDAALFLDQWAATGHPLHTVPKTRIGLAPAAALNICPEFHPQVPVRLSAVRRDRVCAELPSSVPNLSSWFADHFPSWFKAWQHALEASGRNAADYEPMPIHPWQAEHVIAAAPDERFQNGEIELLDGPELAMLPCLSVRSMVPAEDTAAPGFKLPLGLRLTSSVRTITPRSCHMGRRVGRLLRNLFEHDPGFAGKIDVLDEPVGAHFASNGALPELEKHFNFIAREAISTRIAPGHIAIIPAALAEPFPIDGPPLLLGLAAKNGQSAADGLTVFERYTHSFLSLILRTYLVYGIAIEAHGQNMLACFDERGTLNKFLYRDLAGIRIHEPTLKRLGIPLDVHPDRRTVVQDFDQHRIWLRHRAYHSHLGHIAHGFSLATGIAERRYWQLVGEITAQVFDQLRNEVDPGHWKRERHVLLEAPWSGKAYLSMRLQDRVRDLKYTTHNPLRQTDD